MTSSTMSRRLVTSLPAMMVAILLAPAACVAQTHHVSAQVVGNGPAVVAGQEISLNAGLESAYVLQGSPGEAFLVIDLQTRVRYDGTLLGKAFHVVGLAREE